MNTNRDKI